MKKLLLFLVFNLSLQLFGQPSGTGHLRLNGSSEYLQAQSTSSLNVTSNLTIETWVYPCDVNADRCVLTKHSCNANGGYYMLLKTGGKAELVWVYGNGNQVCPAQNMYSVMTDVNAVLPNTWNHIAITFKTDANGTEVLFYINGAPYTGSILTRYFVSGTWVNTTLVPSTPIWQGSAMFRVGAYEGLSGLSGYYNGMVDDIRVWNVTRTPSQIQNSYNSSITTPTSGLVLNLDLSNDVQGIFPDLSGLGNASIYSGGTPKYGTVDCNTYLGDNSFETSNAILDIYPNPADNTLYLPNNIEEFSIYDMSGKQYMLADKDGILDISSLPKGVYTIQLKKQSQAQTRKFVKI